MSEDGAQNELTHRLRVDYLKMIQDVISRMASNSALMKRYSVLLALASISLARYLESVDVLFLGIFLVLAFGIQDANYLPSERRYRLFYDQVRQEDWNIRPSFSLAIPKEIRKQRSGFGAIFSWSVLPLYGFVAAILGVGFFV